VLFSRGRRDRVHMDLQLPMQLVPITTKVVSSNHAHGEVYSIQHHEIKFVNAQKAESFAKLKPWVNSDISNGYLVPAILVSPIVFQCTRYSIMR
jgi:hypothetical protein